MAAPSRRSLRAAKTVLFALALLPALQLGLATAGIGGLGLGANPIETLLHSAGDWGLRLLLVTLAVTPLRRLSGWHWLIGFRRMLGLFAFFYIACHLGIYLLLDQRLAMAAIVEDIVERPYITLGLTAFVLLVPLALTSTRAMMRRLGRRWQQLHRLVYPAAILGVWHFWWQVKQDILEPAIYAAILAALLGFRIFGRRNKRSLRKRRHA